MKMTSYSCLKTPYINWKEKMLKLLNFKASSPKLKMFQTAEKTKLNVLLIKAQSKTSLSFIKDLVKLSIKVSTQAYNYRWLWRHLRKKKVS